MVNDKLTQDERRRLEALAQAITLGGPYLAQAVANAQKGRVGVPILHLLNVADTLALFIAGKEPEDAVDLALTVEQVDGAPWESLAATYEGFPPGWQEAFEERVGWRDPERLVQAYKRLTGSGRDAFRDALDLTFATTAVEGVDQVAGEAARPDLASPAALWDAYRALGEAGQYEFQRLAGWTRPDLGQFAALSAEGTADSYLGLSLEDKAAFERLTHLTRQAGEPG